MADGGACFCGAALIFGERGPWSCPTHGMEWHARIKADHLGAGLWTAEDLLALASVLSDAKMTLGQLLAEMRAAAQTTTC